MSGASDEDLAHRIAAYLQHRQPGVRDVVVDGLNRINGGTSQETYRFRARWSDGDTAVEKRLILRREPPAGLVVAERDLEYNIYRALEGQRVPVPTARFLELDPRWLDRPFFIMDMVSGAPAHPLSVDDPFDGRGEDIARQYWRILGQLAVLDHHALGLDGLRNGRTRGRIWADEIDHWERILDAGERIVDPIARGAIRWMRRNPPPEPAKAVIVHGDYRMGNFLSTAEEGITAIVDWEMCHVGDPHEDIAWGINEFWSMTRFLSLDEGIAEWEAASGLKVDRNALEWWRLFGAVKGSAIWITAEASVMSGQNRDPVLMLTPFRVGPAFRRQVLDCMAQRGAMG